MNFILFGHKARVRPDATLRGQIERILRLGRSRRGTLADCSGGRERNDAGALCNL